MTEPTTPGVDAGQLLTEIIRSLSPRELELLGETGRHHAATSVKDSELHQLAEFWNVLAIAADAVLSQHPHALNDRDLADLELLGDTPTEDET